jgi:isopropylmalate/homocitrate/citramalate synthase
MIGQMSVGREVYVMTKQEKIEIFGRLHGLIDSYQEVGLGEMIDQIKEWAEEIEVEIRREDNTTVGENLVRHSYAHAGLIFNDDVLKTLGER